MPKRPAYDLNDLKREFDQQRKIYGTPTFFHVTTELPNGVNVMIYAGKTKLRTEQMYDCITESVCELEPGQRRKNKDSWGEW